MNLTIDELEEKLRAAFFEGLGHEDEERWQDSDTYFALLTHKAYGEPK